MEDPSRAVLEELGRMELPARRAFMKRQAFPDFVYKFRSIDTPDELARVKSILLDHQLWLSPRSAFNDPFDGRFGVTVKGTFTERLNRMAGMIRRNRPGMDRNQVMRASAQFQKTFTTEHAKKSAHRALEKLGICAFGKDVASLLMWAHYAASHRGIALGFDVAEGWDPFGRLQDVEYNDGYITINYINENSIQPGLKKALARKSRDWVYEGEVRILIVDGAGTVLPLKNPACLRYVVYGCGIKDDVRDSVRSLLEKRQALGLPDVNQLQAVRLSDRYGLELREWAPGMERQPDGFY